MIYLLSPSKKEGTVSLPMIAFTITADNINFNDCDTLIFTSKQAVISANEIDSRWQEYPCIAIGTATKKKIEALGGKVIYAPKKFYGKELADDVQALFSDKKLLYLRPKEVSFNSKAYLEKEGITIEEEIIYETSCRIYSPLEKPKKDAVIIFTSPSTIKCFLKNFIWDESYRAVVIGKATAAYLPKGCQFVIAEEQLIDSCIKKAIEIEKNGHI